MGQRAEFGWNDSFWRTLGRLNRTACVSRLSCRCSGTQNLSCRAGLPNYGGPVQTRVTQFQSPLLESPAGTVYTIPGLRKTVNNFIRIYFHHFSIYRGSGILAIRSFATPGVLGRSSDAKGWQAVARSEAQHGEQGLLATTRGGLCVERSCT